MSASKAASPLDDLTSIFEEWKYGPGKNFSIVRSSSAVVSGVASALLVWILFRSRNGLKITYHRLLFGLSVSDILWSLCSATFGAVAPSELNYIIWNARGSRASCDAFGFLSAVGLFGGLLYMCSLNLYYLAKVKFTKTDTYIAKKLEPWLHLVPILFGAIMSVILLARKRTNATIYGFCTAAQTHEPPHCDGYKDGDTPEGFEIPCGRGRSAQPIGYIAGIITLFCPPIIIGGSLLTIYRKVSMIEQRIARYGAGSLRPSSFQPTTNDASTTDVEGGGGGGRVSFSILSSIRSIFSRRASRTNSDNQDSSQSRAVLQKAVAYSVGYFVTWIWLFIYSVLFLAGKWTTDLPQPKWQIAYWYVYSFFVPLQGLWTFLIYIQPDVIKSKRSSNGNISWSRAFADALWSAVTGRTNSAAVSRVRVRGRREAIMTGPDALRTAAAPGRTGPSHPAPKEKTLCPPPDPPIDEAHALARKQ